MGSLTRAVEFRGQVLNDSVDLAPTDYLARIGCRGVMLERLLFDFSERFGGQDGSPLVEVIALDAERVVLRELF